MVLNSTFINTFFFAIKRIEISNGKPIIYINSKYLLDVMLFLYLHTNCRYDCLVDISSVDYISREVRFEVIYNLLSIDYNSRIEIRCLVEEFGLSSIELIHPAAVWYEREIWDMFGIFFEGNNSLQRILTDYGFNGHPLRKDFPCTGFFDIKYDYITKSVKYFNLSLAQENKIYDYAAVWQK